MSANLNTVRGMMARVTDATKTPEHWPPAADVETARVIRESADDDAHVERAAVHLIRTAKWRPVASEWLAALVATAESGRDEEGEVSKALGCPDCDYTGWVIVERKGVSAAGPCQCRIEDRMQLRPEVRKATPAEMVEQRRILAELAAEHTFGGTA
jgi:hypothetical protein